MNKVIMIGRLSKAPEIKYAGANNTAIARFSMAVGRKYKQEGQPDADFFDVCAFGKLAEFCEKYLDKGIKIALEGELRNNNYKNREGATVYRVEIVASQIEFCESKKNEDKPADKESNSWMSANIEDGELPFN